MNRGDLNDVSPTPRELVDTERAVERLAEVDRAGADPSLTRRVHEATWPMLAPPLGVLAEPRIRIRQGVLTPVRVAAGLALAAALGATWLAGLRPGTTETIARLEGLNGFDAHVESLLAWERTSEVGTQIDQLYVELSLLDPLMGEDWAGDSVVFDGGSM